MRATYYTTIKALIAAVTGINHVERWKNQIELGNKLAALPAVFIEFLPIAYEDMSQRQQVATDVNFVLHLVVKKYTTEDTEDSLIYTLSQAIYTKLQQTEGYHRVNEALDTTNEMLEDFQLTYTIGRLVDEDAVKSTTSVAKPTPEFDESYE